MAVRIGLELDETVLAEVIADLQLSDPPTFVLNHSGRIADHPDLGKDGRFRGLYSPGENLVTIATGLDGMRHETYTILSRHLKNTVLHELRHAFQREHWDDEMKAWAKRGGYHERPEEVDARRYADENAERFKGLVRVTKHRTASSRPRLPR